MKRENKIKSTVNGLDITPLLRFLLQRNVLFFSLSLLSFHSLLSFFLLPFSSARFHQSFYLPSTFSNSFLIYLNIPLQTFNRPTRTTALLYTSLVIPFFCILPPPPLVISLLLSPVQTLQSILPHFLSFLFSPRYLPLP